MAHLYAGNILFIDLSRKEITKEPTNKYAKSFLGGRGINTKLFYDRIKPGVDPLDGGNPLIFGVGPLTGAAISSDRTEITAKSPETGLLGSSNFGGFFGSELKYAGYDHIVFTGKAKKPVYLWIYNDEVEIRDAAPYWSHDSFKTQSLIRQDTGDPDIKIACIGQAGENLVRFASIQHELGHAAARTGMGAVMGSKNLKAVAVRGTKGLTLADPVKFLEVSEEIKELLKNDAECQRYLEQGGSEFNDEFFDTDFIKIGTKGLKGNKQPSQYKMYLRHPSKPAGCGGCPVQCMEEVIIEGDEGGLLGCAIYNEFSVSVACYDTDTSLECAFLSQRYGVDCISSAGIIHWLMELFEEGIITAEDTDGIPMEWGDPLAIRTMLDKMVFREGIGDVLADGMLKAAEHFGRGTLAYADHNRGMPLNESQSPGWLPNFKGSALGQAVSSRGDSMRALSPIGLEIAVSPEEAKKITGTEKASMPTEYEGKPELVKYVEDCATLSDILGVCKWQSGWYLKIFTIEHLAALLTAGSGRNVDVESLYEYANKVRTLETAYVIGEGFSREKQTLPERFFKTIDQGPFKGEELHPAKLEEMKTRYYKLRGWDEKTGIPSEELLKRYGLEDVAQNLKNLNILPEN